jgi:NAD(P)-dependent dehydrogenase (short-subunit alcohol dehydrogenase family)
VVCLGAYASSKAAVKAFADVLRLETLDSGVKIHVAQPGSVDTPMLAQLNAFNAEVHASAYSQSARVIPRYMHMCTNKVHADYGCTST